MKKISRIFAILMAIATLFAFGGCATVEVQGDIYKMDEIFKSNQPANVCAYTEKEVGEIKFWDTMLSTTEDVFNEYNNYSNFFFEIKDSLAESTNTLISIALYVQIEDSADMNFAIYTGRDDHNVDKRHILQSKISSTAGSEMIILYQINKPMTEFFADSDVGYILTICQYEYIKTTQEELNKMLMRDVLYTDIVSDGLYYAVATAPTVKWKLKSVEFVIKDESK